MDSKTDAPESRPGQMIELAIVRIECQRMRAADGGRSPNFPSLLRWKY